MSDDHASGDAKGDDLEKLRAVTGGRIVRLRIKLRRKPNEPAQDWIRRCEERGMWTDEIGQTASRMFGWIEPERPDRKWLESFTGERECLIDGLAPIDVVRIEYHLGPRFGRGWDPDEAVEI